MPAKKARLLRLNCESWGMRHIPVILSRVLAAIQNGIYSKMSFRYYKKTGI